MLAGQGRQGPGAALEGLEKIGLPGSGQQDPIQAIGPAVVGTDQAPAAHRAGAWILQGHATVGAAVEEGPRRAIGGMAEQDRLIEQAERQAGSGWKLAGAGYWVPKAFGVALALGPCQQA